MQTLVDAIIVLGHLPSQSRNSSTEEERLAVRLIRARKAYTLTWQQEAQLDNLMPELLNSVFDYILESPQGLVGNLCSIITLVLNRLSSGSFYPSTAFGDI